MKSCESANQESDSKIAGSHTLDLPIPSVGWDGLVAALGFAGELTRVRKLIIGAQASGFFHIPQFRPFGG